MNRTDTQPPLFRHTDPISSALAAADVADLGAKAAHERMILAAVRENPGLCASELADHLPIDKVQIRKRTPELERAGLLRAGHIRKGKERAEQTWWPA